MNGCNGGDNLVVPAMLKINLKKNANKGVQRAHSVV